MIKCLYNYEKDIPKEIVTTYQKKIPSNQQHKKKAKGKKTERKQTFYEKVLSKAIGKPIDNEHLYKQTPQKHYAPNTHDEAPGFMNDRNSSIDRNHYDPMNQTHHITLSTDYKNDKNLGIFNGQTQEGFEETYSTHQPGGINISSNGMDGQTVSSVQQLSRYANMV